MSIKLATNKIIEKLGEDGANWVQGSWGDGDGSMCLHGAIRACQPVPGDAFLIRQVAERQGWGTGFNDRSGTEWGDVKRVIDERREVTDRDLEETFGPNWVLIVRLVRQAALLTPEQAEQLRKLWDAAWDAARYAAWDAARYAAWDAAVLAAVDAAWDAAGDAAWGSAGNAARGLVVKPLIGQHGFTQEHYDTLTGPWRTLFPNFDETGTE